MAIRVSATETNPTHDISLSDGSTTIGLHLCNGQGERDRRAIRQTSTPRTSLQIQQGDPDYSGYNLPYTPVTQKDWSGGRGQLDFKRDSTKYYDSYRVNTIYGDIILGPAATQATGYYTAQEVGGDIFMGADALFPYGGSYYAVASKFTASSTMTVRSIKLYLSRLTAGSSSVQVSLYSDSAGSPGSSLASSTAVTVTATTATLTSFDLVYSITSGTTYWVVVWNNGDDQLQITYDTLETGNFIKTTGFPPAGWTTRQTDKAIYFKLFNTGAGKFMFFKYRYSEMLCYVPDDGGAPLLFINGHHGMAASNSSDKTKLNTGGSLVGTLSLPAVKIYAGPGYLDDPNWRKVSTYTTSGTNDYMVVDHAWGTTHTTSTEYATIGEGNWTAITGHGLTGPITDICVVNDIIYFAQGDSVVVRKGRWNAGSWAWDDEGANTKATFIELIPTTNGKYKVWLAQSSTSYIYSADPVTWSTDLTLSQKNNSAACGNPHSKITNLIGYGNPKIPYVFKEDSFGSIANDIYAEVPNAELAAVADERNGRAACVYGVYLFFSLLNGFERFYDQTLDDIGPNRGEGLPSTRSGNIVQAIPYPGGIYCAVDAGADGYSSIMFWSSATNGWHELYRAPLNERIRGMDIQIIPSDDLPDRLWFSQGANVYYIDIAINPRKQENYNYAYTGYLITSWYKTTLGEIQKFWRDIQVFTENLGTTDFPISYTLDMSIYYQLDDATDDDDWTALPSDITTSPVDESLITTGYTATGRRIRFKIELCTGSVAGSPRVLAYTINAVTRVPPSKAWTVTFQADDYNVQEGEADMDSLDSDGLLAQLETWGNSDTQAAPLTMRSLVPQHDNKYVFVDAPGVQLREVVLEDGSRVVKAIGTISLYEA